MSESLYDRLGGAKRIAAIVDDSVEMHLKNPLIKSRFENLVGSGCFELHEERNHGPANDPGNEGKRGDTRKHHRPVFDHFTGYGKVRERAEQRCKQRNTDHKRAHAATSEKVVVSVLGTPSVK